MGRALQPLPALGQTLLSPCLFILLISEVLVTGPPLHICEFIPTPSFPGSAGSGGAAPPSTFTPSVLPACTCWRMLLAVPSPHLSQGHSSLSPNHPQQQLKHSWQEGQRCFPGFLFLQAMSPAAIQPWMLAVTILVTTSLPWCQGMFSAIKATSMCGSLFPCVLTTTEFPAWLQCSDIAGNDPRGDTELLFLALSCSVPP